MVDGAAGVAGHVEHLEVRAGLAQQFAERDAVHLRHHHVGHQQVDFLAVLFGGAQRFHAGPRLDQIVAALLQRHGGEVADHFLVFHQQDRLDARAGGALGTDHDAGDGHRLLGRRQKDAERRAFPRLADHVDVPLVLLDDAVDDGQAQAGALAEFLGGEERLEDARLHFAAHAAASVGHGQQHVAAGLDVGRQVVGVRVQDDVAGLDGELAAARHGVAGVDRQIDEHLVDLAGVGLDAREVRPRHDGQFDVLVEQLAEHQLRVADLRIEVEHLGHADVAAAEGEQLRGEADGAVGSLVDLLGGAEQRVARPQARRQQLGEALDDRQQVVEVVGDAAGQPADGFHLLGVAQLVLEVALRRDVGDDAGDLHRAAAGADAYLGAVAHPADRAVGTDDAVLLARRMARLQPGDGPFKDRAVLGVDEVAPGLQAAQQLVRRQARDLLHDRREVAVAPDAGAVRFGAPQTVGHRSHDAAKFRLHLLEPGMALALFADVAHGDQTERPRLDVEPAHRQIDRRPARFLLGAQQEAFLRMEHGGVLRRLLQPIHIALGFRTDQVAGLHFQQFTLGEARQVDADGVDRKHLAGLGIEDEQAVARFLEEGLGKDIQIEWRHGRFRNPGLVGMELHGRVRSVEQRPAPARNAGGWQRGHAAT